MSETTSACDACRRPTALNLLYPFPLAGKFNNTGFRCNICVDTENRLVAKYGIMRDEINAQLVDGPFNSNDLSIGYIRDYLHQRTFPVESTDIVPHSGDITFKKQAKATEEFLKTQDEFMLTGSISDDRLLSIMSFIGSLFEEFDRVNEKRIPLTKIKKLLYIAYEREEGNNE